MDPGYKRLFSQLYPHKGILFFSILAAFALVFVEGLTLWFSSSLLNIIFSPSVEAVEKIPFSVQNINEWLNYHTWNFLSAGGRRDNMAVLRLMCILIPILFAIKNSILYIKNVLIFLLNFKVVESLRNTFYSHIIFQPMRFFNIRRSGTIISHLVKDINDVQNALTKSINHVMTAPLKLVFFLVLLIIINPRLTLLVFTIYPVIGLVISRGGKVIRRRGRRMLESFSDVVAIIHETIFGIKVVKMFHGEGYEADKFRRTNRVFTRNAIRQKLISAALSPINEFVSLLMTSVLLWFVGSKILEGDTSFSSEDFLRYLLILFSTHAPIKQITQVHGYLQQGRSAAQRVFSVLDIAGEEDSGTREIADLSREIVFDSVSFEYPGYDETVLQDISFSVKKGQICALVGSSGSGKSTILDLLPNYYALKKGRITIDGHDIREYSLSSLRSLFGTVSQDTVLFNDTVAQNIAYGAPHIDEKVLQDVISAANAEGFIHKLPAGTETVIGENGITLSGGQKQRLAIARALYSDPAVLVLDEATSALDTESEQFVQDAIDKLMNNRTTFVVAHRLSTIVRADMILVLDQGRIVERGNHEELIQKNGRYKELYDLQFS
ncbi:MAG: ABC transporter ATP-binding protein [Fibrobacterota bacterium]